MRKKKPGFMARAYTAGGRARRLRRGRQRRQLAHRFARRHGRRDDRLRMISRVPRRDRGERVPVPHQRMVRAERPQRDRTARADKLA